MSFLARTPIYRSSLNTDLGNAFNKHQETYQKDRVHSLAAYDPDWINALRNRALKHPDTVLTSSTEAILSLLAAPAAAGSSFQEQFRTAHDTALRHAYPLASALLDEKTALSGLTLDYTLACVDLGLVRAIEDAATTDAPLHGCVTKMLAILSTGLSVPRHEVFRGFFDVYSEAIVYHLLKERCGTGLTISKIKETTRPTPDFECSLTTDLNGTARTIAFYIEVKSLDIVNAPQRLPEIRDAATDAQIEIERQLQAGRTVATAESEIAPYRPYGSAAGYDARSVRGVIETLISKAANNFKASQFQLGPTFALANLLRLPLPGQGPNALAPFFYDPLNGGACVNGIFWNMVFGEHGSPIHRSPEFEGAGTSDGNLQRAGLLVDSSLTPLAPGVMLLYYDRGAYRFNGLYDSQWIAGDHGWTNIETEVVFNALCSDFNSKDNSMTYKYATMAPR